MWLIPALFSALLLGCYEVCKKISLNGNPVLPILHFNISLEAALLLPTLLLSATGCLPHDALFYVAPLTPQQHLSALLKALLVLASWGCGYVAIKNLPLTITGPIKATQPILTLVGALIIFNEHLNPTQWAGVILAILSFYLLAATGKKEGIPFAHNRHIWLMLAAIVTGALSGLYDRYLLRTILPLSLQVWFTLYQAILLIPFHLLLRVRRPARPIVWRWQIPLVSILLLAGDYLYFAALSHPDALISVISMARRSNVLITFLFGAYYFRERNLRAKAFDLFLIFLAMILLFFGTR
jgi:transporter family protein